MFEQAGSNSNKDGGSQKTEYIAMVEAAKSKIHQVNAVAYNQ